MLRRQLAARLAALKRERRGSSGPAARALFMAEPSSIVAGEIAGKGNINRRAALTRRARLVETLYRSPLDPRVIEPSTGDV